LFCGMSCVAVSYGLPLSYMPIRRVAFIRHNFIYHGGIVSFSFIIG